MKQSHIFKQALCLAALMIMACSGKPLVKKPCFKGGINERIKVLLNKTEDFIKLFPDKNSSVKLLTNTLKEDFMKNCSTRSHLLSFYVEKVFSEHKISAEAKKRGIDTDFKIFQDWLKLCPSTNCDSTEETQNMKELREKLTGVKTAQKIKTQYKAVNELGNLLLWIHEFVYNIKT